MSPPAFVGYLFKEYGTVCKGNIPLEIWTSHKNNVSLRPDRRTESDALLLHNKMLSGQLTRLQKDWNFVYRPLSKPILKYFCLERFPWSLIIDRVAGQNQNTLFLEISFIFLFLSNIAHYEMKWLTDSEWEQNEMTWKMIEYTSNSVSYALTF